MFLPFSTLYEAGNNCFKQRGKRNPKIYWYCLFIKNRFSTLLGPSINIHSLNPWNLWICYLKWQRDSEMQLSQGTRVGKIILIISGGFNVITRVPPRRKQGVVQRRPATLEAEEAWRDCRAFLKMKRGPCPRHLGGLQNSALWTLAFCPVRPILDFRLIAYKICDSLSCQTKAFVSAATRIVSKSFLKGVMTASLYVSKMDNIAVATHIQKSDIPGHNYNPTHSYSLGCQLPKQKQITTGTFLKSQIIKDSLQEDAGMMKSTHGNWPGSHVGLIISSDPWLTKSGQLTQKWLVFVLLEYSWFT